MCFDPCGLIPSCSRSNRSAKRADRSEAAAGQTSRQLRRLVYTDDVLVLPYNKLRNNIVIKGLNLAFA